MMIHMMAMVMAMMMVHMVMMHRTTMTIHMMVMVMTMMIIYMMTMTMFFSDSDSENFIYPKMSNNVVCSQIQICKLSRS